MAKVCLSACLPLPQTFHLAQFARLIFGLSVSVCHVSSDSYTVSRQGRLCGAGATSLTSGLCLGAGTRLCGCQGAANIWGAGVQVDSEASRAASSRSASEGSVSFASLTCLCLCSEPLAEPAQLGRHSCSICAAVCLLGNTLNCTALELRT